MQSATLTSFVDQLAAWGRHAIDQGRTPFRKVEVFPSLLTKRGDLAPALVFWINRDSFMAGGLVLCPTDQTEEILNDGRALAEALGLQHFVTWSSHRVDIWHSVNGIPVALRSIPLNTGRGQEVAAFQKLFQKLLDELKVLSVMGALPPSELDAVYLTNLCREAVIDILPALTAEVRILAAQKAVPAVRTSPDSAAAAKGLMVVLRLLTLTLLDLLPSSVHPEGLERALNFALPKIPDTLSRPLTSEPNEIPLPESAAVRLHHLLRRLQQLAPAKDRSRTLAALEALVPWIGQQATGCRFDNFSPVESGSAVLSVNSTSPSPIGAALMELAPPVLLALNALLRFLRQEPEAAFQSSDPCPLSLPQAPAFIHGGFVGNDPLVKPDRNRFSAALRASWPTRRFVLPKDIPEWTLRTIHVLGLSAPQAQIDLILPDTWLSAPWGDLLWEICRKEFFLQSLTCCEESMVRLHLRRTTADAGETLLSGPFERVTAWHELREKCREHLYLALTFPDELYRLLNSNLLQWTAERDFPPDLPDEVELFRHSSIGQTLAAIAENGVAPRRQSLSLSPGLPLPPADRLARLTPLLGLRLATGDSTQEIDHEIIRLLGMEFSGLPVLQASQGPSEPIRHTRERFSRASENQLSTELFVDGIPCFPEHYLFDFYRPQLEIFQINRPLHLDKVFFERILLKSELEEQIEVDGEARAHALILCSCKAPVEIKLPQDNEILETILRRYITDLLALLDKLTQLTHANAPDARSAERLAVKIWSRQPLPPKELILAAASLFPELK